jgi:hypothetical protein
MKENHARIVGMPGMADRRAVLIEAGVRPGDRRVTCDGWRKLETSRVDFTVRGEPDPAAEGVAVSASDVEAEVNGTDGAWCPC